MAKEKKGKTWEKWLLITLWVGVISPLAVVAVMLSFASSGSFGPLPTFEELENPKSDLATIVYSADAIELGAYYRQNRVNSRYDEIPQHLVDLLVATEDERFYSHSGIDFEGLVRAVIHGGSQGGASTLTQQLAKMLFHRPEGGGWNRIKQKFKEWIIAARLERNYTKQEIITMYLNKFDYIHNAVGVKRAAQIYFNTTLQALSIQEAAMLVGMAKNPSLYNPKRDSATSYRRREVVLKQLLKNSDNPLLLTHITREEYDSLRVLPMGLDYQVVDHQEGLAPYFREILRKDMKDLLVEREVIDTLYAKSNGDVRYKKKSVNIDGKEYSMRDLDISPDKCENDTLQIRINRVLYIVNYTEKEGNCSCTLERYKYGKPTGEPYNIYTDGLRIYTTIDSRMQAYAEKAVELHLGGELQEDMFDNIKRYWKNPPFSNDLTNDQINNIVRTAMNQSDRGKVLNGKLCVQCNRPAAYISEEENEDGEDVWRCSACKHETLILTEKGFLANFSKPTKMKVFAWKTTKEIEKTGLPRWKEVDTTLTPRDSILYYKSFLQVGMMTMDPHTGFVKAWVGGPNFKHFKFDHVRQSKRQVGSTFKPFLYATAIRDGVSPCETILNQTHCFDVPDQPGTFKQWCPKNSDGTDSQPYSLYYGLANSMNTITAGLLKYHSSPAAVVNLARDMGITSFLEPVPSICLGVFDVSVNEMTAAYSTFANKGIYIEPVIILRIEDKNGNTVYDAHPETREALDEFTSYTMIEMMKGVTHGAYNPYTHRTMGTGVRLRWGNRPYGQFTTTVAGKTGTTQNQSDGWFMGVTPDLVTGVWVGADDRSVRFKMLRLGMGTNQALPIFGYFMKQVYADKSLKVSQGDFEAPLGYIPLEEKCAEIMNKGAAYETVEEPIWNEDEE